jgi:hypothetical protein
MKILLVDDSPKHRRAGVSQLEALGHEVVALSDYTEARKRARSGEFDVALLDLLMPAETTTLGPDAIAKYVGEEIGVGFPLALSLALMGVRLIGVATDMNHHNHPMSAIVDWFPHQLTVNQSCVLFKHARLNDDGSKDWGRLLQQLLDQ